MDLSFLNVLLPMLFQGLKVTIYIAVVGILLGFLLGAVTGFVLQTNCRVLKAIAGIYIMVSPGSSGKPSYTIRVASPSVWESIVLIWYAYSLSFGFFILLPPAPDRYLSSRPGPAVPEEAVLFLRISPVRSWQGPGQSPPLRAAHC